MKVKNFVGLVFFVFLAVALVGCSIAPADGAIATPTVVTEVQMYVIGVMASAVLYAIKILADRFPQWTIKREWLTVLLYVVALVLSTFWGGITLPGFAEFSDPVTFVSAAFGFVTAFLMALAPSVSFATLIYNILLKRVFDGWAAGQ